MGIKMNKQPILCRVCRAMCMVMCRANAAYLLVCAGCAGVTCARVRVIITILFKSCGGHVRTRNTPAHHAHPAHALFYAGVV
jgi:hypothetical protein